MHRLAAILALAGCTAACGSSVDDVKSSPVHLTVSVPASWDRVGACLTAAYANDLETVYLPVPSEQRAQIITKYAGPGVIQYKSAAYVFDIAGPGPSTVTVRSPPPYNESFDRQTKAKIEACGKI